MAITNYERVGKALEQLKIGLAPFVDREIKDAIANNTVSMQRIREFLDDPIVAKKSITDLGDILIVGLNSDESVKKLHKGANRPIQDQDSRALILASLHHVSAVILFDEDTPAELIKNIQPDVLVKGGDWKPEQIVGYDTVKARGGDVVSIEFVPGFSTTAIEQKIKGSGN